VNRSAFVEHFQYTMQFAVIYDKIKKYIVLTFFSVHHILNVTREIDNFFPGMFNYLNIRVYDDEKTDLLKHWDDTFKYITRAR